MRIRKFAVELLNEVAGECDNRLILNLTDNEDLLLQAASKTTELIEFLVELPEDLDLKV